MAIGKTDGAQSLPRPRIGIDLHVAGGIYQGSRTHCLELFSRVAAITPECDFVLLTADPQVVLSFSCDFSLPNVSLVAMPKKPAAARLLWQLPQIVRQSRLSLLHLQYIAPPFLSCPTAVTVHDVLFESHPEYFEKAFVYRSRLLVPYSIQRSAAIFTVSDYTRNEICRRYSVAPDAIHAIPNGVDVARFYPGEEGCESVRALGLQPGEYFLTVGRLEPRKNHAMLLRAWHRLKTPRPKLIFVGQRHFRFGEIFELIRTLDLAKDVTILDDVSDAQLPSIYRNAKGFIYCSWAEGFGMPLLEGMASGIPVISSRNTALSEVCADAAILIEPDDPSGICDAISAIVHRPELAADLVRRGLSRVEQFTWEKAALTVREVYLRHFGLSIETMELQGLASL
jgi:glycosyltransferase involved in cell wall biosynthesis